MNVLHFGHLHFFPGFCETVAGHFQAIWFPQAATFVSSLALAGVCWPAAVSSSQHVEPVGWIHTMGRRLQRL